MNAKRAANIAMQASSGPDAANRIIFAARNEPDVDPLYAAWKRRRDAEIAFESVNRELVAAGQAMDELLANKYGLQSKCPACARKRNGKKCRAHTNFHPQFK